MDFKQLALAARTCRRFEEERPLQMADLEWLVDCARLTPCARNAQQLRYSLVGPGETCQRLFGMTKWAAALKDWTSLHPDSTEAQREEQLQRVLARLEGRPQPEAGQGAASRGNDAG